jgi:hypothetical protein
VRGVQTNAVRGDFSLSEALDLLVTRTPLVVSRDATTGALAARPLSAAAARPPRVLVRSAWQSVNIGDIAVRARGAERAAPRERKIGREGK